MSNQKVLIVGGGVSGLALAQALRGAGIAYEVFERDESKHGRAQGWALNLLESLDAMKGILPDDLSDIFQAAGVTRHLGLPSSITVFDGQNGESVLHVTSPPLGSPNSFIRVNRGLLRVWLAQKLSIQWSKRFVRYEEDASGVTVHFNDGTSSKGTVLVAADGSSSHVREQLLGHEAGLSSVAPFGLIVGDRRVDKPTYERFLKLSNSFYMADGVKARCFVGIRDVASDLQSADLYWFVCWSDITATELGDKHWLNKSSRRELREKAIELVADIPEHLREFVDASSDADIIMPPLKFREFVSPASLPEGRVTLMGDAAHSMTPFRGAGANTAIVDAADLANAFIEANKNGLDLQTALKPYHETMLPRGRHQVLETRKNGPRSGPDEKFWAGVEARLTGTDKAF